MKEVKLQKYPAYKDSGVEWLGEIPEHWDAVSLGSILELKSDKNHPDYEVLSVYREYGVIKKDSRDDNHNATSLDTSNYKAVEPGDLVVNKMKAWQGSMGVSPHKGIVSPAYIICRVNSDKIHPEYLHQLLRCDLYIGEYNRLSYGVRVGQWDMHYEDFKHITTTIPPIAEQTSIANFLDIKTAQIESAISIKQKQIELLKERRQILIHRAVTRGLNPDVKLKDSGVEWIGEIPENWEVKRLKYLLRSKLKYGANESGIEYDPNLPRYVRITDFGQDGKLSEDNKLSLSWKQGSDYLLKDGDILFARSGATVGKTYQFKNSMSIEDYYCYAGYLIKAEVNEGLILSDFLYLYTNSPLFNKWKEVIFIKVTIENIGADKYSQLNVILPPIEEQIKILHKYYYDNSKISTAITLKEKEIEKLKEYKSVLINEAVSGKIKVG